jgi:carbon-monoxide dehydrogenase medium subunit
MYEFDYRKVGSTADAKSTHGAGEDATYLAGGMTLLPTLKQRLASPTELIDLKGIVDLSGISDAGDGVEIKALTTHAAVAASDLVAAKIPALSDLAGMIGDPQVRNRGTIGGSVANNDPSADYPAACLGLDATIVTEAREISADDYFKGLFETALEPGELITSVRFPAAQSAAYQKFPNPASRYAMVGVFVARTGGGVRVAVTGASQSGVFRWAEAEAALASNFAKDAVAELSVDAADMIGDIHGPADYRAHLVTVLTGRAVAAAG